MTDAAYLFKSTAAERKRNGVGDFHKKRCGGRGVRMPSDYLSKKEKAMLNSDVTKINLSAPVVWGEFKNWPKDLQREYIHKLDDTYHVRTDSIADMMGVNEWTLRKYRRELGCPGKKGRGLPVDAAGWRDFLGEDPRVIEVSTPEVEPEKTEEVPTYTIHEECVKVMQDMVKQIDVQNIAEMLRMLVGTGAKLTIEVTL